MVINLTYITCVYVCPCMRGFFYPLNVVERIGVKLKKGEGSNKYLLPEIDRK